MSFFGNKYMKNVLNYLGIKLFEAETDVEGN